jgi:4-diphosphocytidyl-2-C-methyl-D-erythritol kinase
MATLTLPAFAKINWTLDVVGRREDGYHELRTIYQTIGLADRVTVELTTAPGVEVATDGAGVPDGPANIAHRAATAYLEAAGLAARAGARVFIRKEIPAGGGLGGGSSNAAVTVVALERLAGLRLSDADRFRVARRLGADVPLFFVGGTVLGVGRGDEVYALAVAPPTHLVVANPGVLVETAGVFRRFGAELTARDPAAIMLSFLSALRMSATPTMVGNDLASAVVKDHPGVGAARAALLGAGAAKAWMTGSGASMVGIFESAGAALRAVDELADAGLWARAVETLDRTSYRAVLGL